MEGIQANANAGDPTRWDWVGTPIEARLVQDRTMFIGRVTGQFGKTASASTPSTRPLRGHAAQGRRRRAATIAARTGSVSATTRRRPQMSPEATSTAGRGYFDVPFYVNQGTWTMPATNKLLFEAGVHARSATSRSSATRRRMAITNLIPVTEQSNAINPADRACQYAPVANYRYRARRELGAGQAARPTTCMASASYVTGAHSAKFGYQFRKLDLLDKDVANSTQLGYRFNQGVPNAVSYYLPDFGRRTITKTNSFFVQDSWTHGRLTLQGALRYDHVSSYAPSELNGTTNTSFLNPQPITIPQTPGVDAYNDITPRVGVAYDVFGNGKTALKFNWGKYLAYAANDSPYTSTNPGATIVRNVQNRGWTDIDSD